MNTAPFKEQLAAVQQWQHAKATPICWIQTRMASEQSDFVAACRPQFSVARYLPLRLIGVDNCLLKAFNSKSTSGLLTALDKAPGQLLILDGLELVQYEDDHEIFDSRFKLLLLGAAEGLWSGLQILVVSMAPPPANIPVEQLKHLTLPVQEVPRLNLATIPQKYTQLYQLLFLCPFGLRLSLLHLVGKLNFANPATNKTAEEWVNDALNYGLDQGFLATSKLTTTAYFHVKVNYRAAFTAKVDIQHLANQWAEVLLSESFYAIIPQEHKNSLNWQLEMLESAIHLKVMAQDITGAINCYWTRIGNYQNIGAWKALHFGKRLCVVMNQRLSAKQLTPEFNAAVGSWVVLNDWGVFELLSGNVEQAYSILRSAQIAAQQEQSAEANPMLLALNKGWQTINFVEALIPAGKFTEAHQSLERSKKELTEAGRTAEGIPTQDIMGLTDTIFSHLLTMAAHCNLSDGARHLVNELEDRHQQAVEKLAEVNRYSVIPIGGPTEVVRADLLEGKAVAVLAFLEGQAELPRAQELAQTLKSDEKKRLQVMELDVLLLQVRSYLTHENYQAATDLLERLKGCVDQHNHIAFLGEWNVLKIRTLLLLGKIDEAKTRIATTRFLTQGNGLWLWHNQLLELEVQVLREEGELEQAIALEKQMIPLEPVPRYKEYQKREGIVLPPKLQGGARRKQLHEFGEQALRDYFEKGTPYALSLRKYGLNIFHGPFENGPQLIENKLLAIMPPGSNVISIQNQSETASYEGEEAFFDRSTPSLFLSDDEWKDKAVTLIRHADLIVSEALMLSPAVQFELEQALESDAWDKTVLILPPPSSEMETIDGESIIRKFPRCIWADEFHTSDLGDSFLIRDLIERVTAINALPEEQRSLLADRELRLQRFPIDMELVAKSLEMTASWQSQYVDEDDRVKYYGYWYLFRANEIRKRLLSSDKVNDYERIQLIDNYLQMGYIMSEYKKEGERIVFTGDLTEAFQCATSALSLLSEFEDKNHLLYNHFTERVTKFLGNLQGINAVVKIQPERFIFRPRFSLFPKK